MGGGGGSADSGEPEFQVAPMIDVLLTLLIFFMSITTAQIEAVDKDIKLPIAADAKARKPEVWQKTVNLKYKGEGIPALMTYGGREWEDRDALANELVTIAGQLLGPDGATKLEVLLRADRLTPAKEVQAAMAVVAQATSKIAFATYNK
jgi:biopolymer transport protein ExbD